MPPCRSDAPELEFKRIRVKGEEEVDLATALQEDPERRGGADRLRRRET